MKSRFSYCWPIVSVALLLPAAAHAQGRRSPRLLRRIPASTVPSGERAYSEGRFALSLDGAAAGFLPSVSGGNARAELATHQLGPTNAQRKNIATFNYEPITVEVGMGMSKGFYEWIKQSFRHESMRKSGEIHAMDFDGNSQSLREFRDAYIQEVTIPALDAASKEPGYMTVKLAPREMVSRPGTGRPVAGTTQPAAKHKQWLCSNFRVEIGDLPCARVSKINSFIWRQGVIKDEVGQFREPTKHPAKVEVPSVKLTIVMADIGPWQDWVQRVTQGGPNAQGAQVDGAITFLAPNLGSELARIDLFGLRPVSLQPAQMQANQEQVARFSVELHCADMAFNYLAK
jgi:phage tail-like protein